MNRGKLRAALALCLLMAMIVPAARADTAQELALQAQTPWRETITAHGRTLDFDVTAEVPQVGAMGVYRVRQVRDEQWRSLPQPELPPKRRGIARRRKADEVFAPDALPVDYASFGNPYTAAQFLADTQARLAPVLAQATGTQARWTELTGISPVWLYDKNAGQWLDTAIEGAVGGYSLGYSLTFMGAPLAEGRPYRDWEAFYAEGREQIFPPSWFVSAAAESGEAYSVYASLPALVQTIEAEAELVPLSCVLEMLRSLAQEGLLRAVENLTLGYGTFAVAGEESGDALLLPVWTARAEIYQNAQSEPHESDGDVWRSQETIYIDARTGALIDLEWVEHWPEGKK